MPLSELLAAEGLEGRIDEVVAWARARTDEILATEALDDELIEVLGGDPPAARAPRTSPAITARGNTQPGVPLPVSPEGASRAPLPPVPQRPDRPEGDGDEAEDLEMLDEDDLELVEDLGGDEDDEGSRDDDGARGDAADEDAAGEGDAAASGDGAGEDDGSSGDAADSSPEWKRALAAARSDDV